MHKLLYPFQFFALQNKEVAFINLLPTLLIGGAILLPFWALPGANFFGPGGFLSGLTMLTAALTGFYVAALTAAATFAHPDLDKVMIYGAVRRRVTLEDGTKELQSLTRREFVCLVFGFLAFSAMVFTIAGAMASAVAPAIPKSMTVARLGGRDVIPDLALGAKLLFSIWIGHLFSVTSLGLYYLMDRLHRRDKKVLTAASDRMAA